MGTNISFLQIKRRGIGIFGGISEVDFSVFLKDYDFIEVIHERKYNGQEIIGFFDDNEDEISFETDVIRILKSLKLESITNEISDAEKIIDRKNVLKAQKENKLSAIPNDFEQSLKSKEKALDDELVREKESIEKEFAKRRDTLKADLIEKKEQEISVVNKEISELSQLISEFETDLDKLNNDFRNISNIQEEKIQETDKDFLYSQKHNKSRKSSDKDSNLKENNLDEPDSTPNVINIYNSNIGNVATNANDQMHNLTDP